MEVSHSCAENWLGNWLGKITHGRCVGLGSVHEKEISVLELCRNVHAGQANTR